MRRIARLQQSRERGYLVVTTERNYGDTLCAPVLCNLIRYYVKVMFSYSTVVFASPSGRAV